MEIESLLRSVGPRNPSGPDMPGDPGAPDPRPQRPGGEEGDSPEQPPTGPRTPYPVDDPGVADPNGPGSEPDVLPGRRPNPGVTF